MPSLSRERASVRSWRDAGLRDAQLLGELDDRTVVEEQLLDDVAETLGQARDPGATGTSAARWRAGVSSGPGSGSTTTISAAPASKPSMLSTRTSASPRAASTCLGDAERLGELALAGDPPEVTGQLVRTSES